MITNIRLPNKVFSLMVIDVHWHHFRSFQHIFPEHEFVNPDASVVSHFVGGLEDDSYLRFVSIRTFSESNSLEQSAVNVHA